LEEEGTAGGEGSSVNETDGDNAIVVFLLATVLGLTRLSYVMTVITHEDHIRCAGKPADIAVDQIRTLSKARLGEAIGSLSPSEAASLRRLITEMYGE
jgi:mRNA-degrading endonuclease toxin of MazEF toxin-antitoxin module